MLRMTLFGFDIENNIKNKDDTSVTTKLIVSWVLPEQIRVTASLSEREIMTLTKHLYHDGRLVEY